MNNLNVHIIGCTGALGYSLSKMFLNVGANVTGVYRSNFDVANELSELGVNCIKIDIATTAYQIAAQRQSNERFILINALAKSITPKPFHKISKEDFDEQYQLNVGAYISLLTSNLKTISNRKSIIVCVLSGMLNDIESNLSFLPYLAAKKEYEFIVDITKPILKTKYNINVLKYYPKLFESKLTKNWYEMAKKNDSVSVEVISEQMFLEIMHEYNKTF